MCVKTRLYKKLTGHVHLCYIFKTTLCKHLINTKLIHFRSNVYKLLKENLNIVLTDNAYHIF